MLNNKTSNTKRIAQNTIVLYIRMVVVLLITLYTSRIVLKALGVEDFGLYGVIGGVVGLTKKSSEPINIWKEAECLCLTVSHKCSLKVSMTGLK